MLSADKTYARDAVRVTTTFERHSSVLGKRQAKKGSAFLKKFLLCIVFYENFDKKSLKLNIYKSDFSEYNNIAVGGTNYTASRTTVIRTCGISSL